MMHFARQTSLLATVVLAIAPLTGCTQHLNAYRSLAETGRAYAEATDAVYDRYLAASIDASSEALLASRDAA